MVCCYEWHVFVSKKQKTKLPKLHVTIEIQLKMTAMIETLPKLLDYLNLDITVFFFFDNLIICFCFQKYKLV